MKFVTDIAPTSPENVCSQCRLPIGHVGSFTYWIFREGRCQCNDTGLPGQVSVPGPSSNNSLTTPSGINNPIKQTLNDRYELIECVGRGAMGYVYKGLDQATGKVVALKLLRPELARNELAVKRLIREVAVISSLKSSHLNEVHGYGQEKDGLPYLVMEFIDGDNLADILDSQGKLKQSRAIEIFLQLCSGLMCAHTNGIIHRDLKPGNVIVQPLQNGQERAIIVDFGFAGLLHEGVNAVRLTQEGEAFGSPAYMSPEQCLGENLDVRSDIYSMGCLMYEALTGLSPLMGENVLATVAKQVREIPQSLRIHDSSIPEEIDELVLKCLNKEPLLRYQSAGDLRIDLEKIKNGAYVNTSKRGAKQGKSDKSSSENKILRIAEDGYRKTATLISLVLLAAVVVGGLTGGAVWMFMQSQVKPDFASVKSPTLPAVPTKQIVPAVTSNHPSEAPKTPAKHAEISPTRALPVKLSSQPPNKSAARHTSRVHTERQSVARHAHQDPPASSSSWATLKELRVHK